uniref:Endosome-associated-trafficking regulator 1 n=1 Tax=Anopheles christyi TaxID=43041 RepID=A0A182K2Y0_9DIPT
MYQLWAKPVFAARELIILLAMAKDNNNINTDDLTAATSSSSVKAVPSSSSTTTEGENVVTATAAEPQSTSPSLPPATSSIPETAPRREENPFSFKHFLKWDGNHATNGGTSAGGSAPSSSINHSRSASSINGNGSASLADGGAAATNGTLEVKTGSPSLVAGSNGSSTNGGSNLTTVTTATTSTGSPSKSATTSSLNVVSSTTGARPKIPQFQSVNTLSSESKMKRSPRFPSFDSQSSLSDFADDRFGSIYQSRSNGSFSSDYPGTGGGGAGGNGGLREDTNGIEQLGEQVELLRGYVQRSYSNFDLDSPGSSSAVAADRRNDMEMHNEPPSRGLVGAAEFSAALPDFVQDHLVMEQWYNTLPKGTGSGSSGSADFDDMLDLTGVANVSGGGGGAPLSSCNDIPFDLTASSTTSSGRPLRDQNATTGAGHRHSMGIRLDLPSRGGSGGGGANPAGPELGFDLPPRSPTSSSSELPPDLTEGNAGSGGGGDAGGQGGRTRSYYYSVSPPPGSSGTTADKIHRLPDFLSDGPIHSSGRLADVTHDTPHASETSSATIGGYRQNRRQWETQYQNRIGAESLENERLRRELEASRRTVSEQSRRIRELERDLETMVSLARPGGNGSTQSNASSFLQAKTRAVTAEAEMKQLRQKLSNMSVEMDALRKENETLKVEACGGAIGGSTGAGASARVRQNDGGDHGSRSRRDRSSAFLRAQTVALRQAASTAESNLRQLLSGVENLRTMANQIETFRNTQDEVKSEGVSIPLEDYLHDVGVNSDDDDDDDDDDEPFGPAL